MIRLFAAAGFAALLAACAAPPGGADDPMHASRGSTPAGQSKAADLGFHGPMHRIGTVDGPN